MKNYFISAIGTNVGKTLTAAIIVEQLKADYWKPLQCGDLDNSDSKWVKDHISNNLSVVHSEAYRLKGAFSPHKSADLEGVSIDLAKVNLPKSDRTIIIEGAGGLMVPLNKKDLMVDLIKKIDCELILVSQNYLGSINHTLMSLAVIKAYNIPFKGIVINGDKDEYTESIYFSDNSIPFLGRIPHMDIINKQAIAEIRLNL